jgi:hypothetical protein
VNLHRWRILFWTVFCLITMGNAYPYSDLYQKWNALQSCACCSTYDANCPRCNRLGHRDHAAQEHIHDAQRLAQKTGKSVLSDAPCSAKHTERTDGFIGEPFLPQKFHLATAFIFGERPVYTSPRLIQRAERPQAPPPKTLS